MTSDLYLMKFPALENLQAWMNEKFSPELLEHKTHIVDCILEQIKEMVSLQLMGISYPSSTLPLKKIYKFFSTFKAY